MRYLVTTDVTQLPTDHQIFMVDGTVPDWSPHPGDRHWDHHRSGGKEIQIDEMPWPIKTLIEDYSTGQPPCIVTPQMDADACCAAAWLQLPRSVLQPETVAKLRAIAWDCDHLMTPPDLQSLAEFAAKAVVGLRTLSHPITEALSLPKDRRQWTAAQWQVYMSKNFQQGTEWFLMAACGERPWPGEQGEADYFLRSLQNDASQLIADGRICLIPTARKAVAVCDLKDIGRYIDPRAFHQALASITDSHQLRPETLLIREHKHGGVQYTLGCLPHHLQTPSLDYTAGTFERLSQAELGKDNTAEPWGGRRTVGGSGWNRTSFLTPEEVIALLDEI